MADPFGITAGVIGVLSSLITLSMRINDFRKDVQDAESEIRQLTHEVDDLTLILKQLEDAKARGKLPGNLTNDLVTLLQRLNTAVIETELHLKGAAGKKLRGAYWAFTGKSQCNQLCRRLESYKSTLNLTLTMADVCVTIIPWLELKDLIHDKVFLDTRFTRRPIKFSTGLTTSDNGYRQQPTLIFFRGISWNLKPSMKDLQWQERQRCMKVETMGTTPNYDQSRNTKKLLLQVGD